MTAPTGLSRPPSTAAANASRRIGCISVGCSTNCVGSAIRPATAPSIAARPQPIASITSTRTPTSDAAAGRSAAARIARPTFVNWKSAHSATTEMIDTAKTPMSCAETATPPLRKTLLPNGDCMNLMSAPQIHATTPSIRMNRPSVTITIAITDRCWTGRMNTPYVTTPNTKPNDEREEEREPVRHAPLEELVARHTSSPSPSRPARS